jgi:hypothetical protein
MRSQSILLRRVVAVAKWSTLRKKRMRIHLRHEWKGTMMLHKYNRERRINQGHPPRILEHWIASCHH